MARYVPQSANCDYDSAARTYVWHLGKTKGGPWLSGGIGYSPSGCLGARDACCRAGNCGSGCNARAKDPVPQRQLNTSGGGRTQRAGLPNNCFAKDNMKTLCWESPVGSGKLACKKGGQLNPAQYPLSYIFDVRGNVTLNDTSCKAIRSEWCKQFTTDNCAGSGASSTPSGPVDKSTDADCNSWGAAKGLCVFGKSILKGAEGIGGSAGQWAQSPIAQFMPVMLLGGGVVLVAIMLKGR